LLWHQLCFIVGKKGKGKDDDNEPRKGKGKDDDNEPKKQLCIIVVFLITRVLSIQLPICMCCTLRAR
jgi:hypothetical protein